MTRKYDNKHLEYVRSLPCIATFKEFNVVAHHVRTYWNSGMAMKPDDIYTLPLHEEQHEILHRIGEINYWEKIGINPFEMILKLLHEKN